MVKCNDIDLVVLLDTDDDIDLHRPEISRHLESCQHCQDRLALGAADTEQWDEVQRQLFSGGIADPEYVQSLAARQKWKRPKAWTDAMAQRLLSPASHPEMLGRVGRYDVERLIGHGGMGVVLKAYDTELNRPVAVKLLAPHLAQNGAARKRFAREARAAAAVVDEHVVAIHNVEPGDNSSQPPFLVMKYIAGGSLQQRLDREGPLEVCEILRIGMQTAKGLAAAHAQGLIHRDVKPSNILLDEGVDRALLTDFGLARAEDEACLTRSGFQPGTPHYMSPEQVRGEALDARSDLFSLGCVLYALCTGHPPFRADSGYAVLRRITDDTARPIRETNPDVPQWLDQVVMKLLSKSPEDRFESAEEVAELMEDCLAHVQHPTTTPLPQSIAFATSTFAFRPWKPLLGLAMAALVAFAGFLIVLELDKGTLTIESEIDDVAIRIKQGDETVERLTVRKSGEAVRVAAGNYVVEIDGTTDALMVKDGQVSLRRGENEIVKIVRTAGTPAPTDIASADAHNPVAFVLGESNLAKEDRIEIQSITSSGNGFEVGATVTVKGIYTLESAESAKLCFFSTRTLSHGEKPTVTPVRSSQRTAATRGTHPFELSKVIMGNNSPHVSFYDSETGQGFGGVYFSEQKKETSTGPHNPVAFVLGKSNLAKEDRIEIQSITSSGNGIEIGATVTVKGVYTLESAESAKLCFFSTRTLSRAEKPTSTPVRASQRTPAKRGTHPFELSKVIMGDNSPHVSFYDSKTGQGFGGVYFSEQKKQTSKIYGHSKQIDDAVEVFRYQMYLKKLLEE